MSIGGQIADALPDSVIEYVHEHPRVVYVVTIPIVAFAVVNLVKAVRLHVAAEAFVGEVQKTASEALGG